MNKYIQKVSGDIDELSGNAQALIAATADISGEKIEEARQRLSSALERVQELYRIGCNKSVEGSQALDEELQRHSFRYIAIVAGIGVVLGCAIANRCACNRPSCK